MNRILASITTLAQHLHAVANDSDVYRPPACPQCSAAGMWCHGCYHRKADRSASAGESLNPVPVLRFLCPACQRTCSRLPACIAPRRWYDWALQQAVLLLLLAGCSVHQCCNCTHRARSTVRRWRDWLDARGDNFAFFLRSRFPELGRLPERVCLWCHVMQSMSLAQAMAWCDRELIVP